MMKWEDLCLNEIGDSHVKAMLAMEYATYQYDKWMETLLRDFDISYEQFNILKILEAAHPGTQPFSLKDVQVRLVNQTKNTTRLVEKLRKKALVDSHINPNNRRQLQITITQKGLDLLATIDSPFNALLNKVKTSVSEEEATQLTTILAKIYSIEP